MRKLIWVRLFLSATILLAGLFFALMLSVFINNALNETAFAQHNLIRLHVLANSNSPKDQDLKLLVRDTVIEETKNILAEVRDKQEAHQLLLSNKDKIESAATARVRGEGYAYPVAVQIGKFSFPLRQYGDLSLPEGIYDAVRVEIGSGAGDTWWCVLFPPLCLSDLEGANSDLLTVNAEAEGKSFAFRLKFWDHFSQTQYARTIQRWWRASAAEYSSFLR